MRQYTEQPIEAEKIRQLQDLIDECNREGGLHIQLVTDEPNAFSNFIAHYSKFHGVRIDITTLRLSACIFTTLCFACVVLIALRA